MRRSTAILAATVAMGLAGGSVAEAAVTVLAPGASVAGRTIGEWTQNWWQWAMAQGASPNAFFDTTGAAAGIGQSGPVFHVAGTALDSAIYPTVNRTFSVPWNAYVLIPLVNTMCAPPADAPPIDTCATGIADLIDSLHATIDGVPITEPTLFTHRETSGGFFGFTAATDSAFPFYAPGDYTGAYGDGYYLMLAPLGLSTHVINFGGGVSEYDFFVDITATITGVPEPTSLGLLGAALTMAGLLARKRQKPAGLPI